MIDLVAFEYFSMFQSSGLTVTIQYSSRGSEAKTGRDQSGRGEGYLVPVPLGQSVLTGESEHYG